MNKIIKSFFIFSMLLIFPSIVAAQSFRGVGTIGSTTSTCSTQRFWYDGTNMFAVSAMVTGE